MSKILKEEFHNVRTEALNLINKAREEKRDLTAEEKQENDRRFARCNTIKQQMEDEQRFASLAVQDAAEEVVAALKGNPVDSKAKQEFHAGSKVTGDAHREAVNTYLRTGQRSEKFAVVYGPGGGTNGIVLPAAPPVFIKRQLNPVLAALQAFNVPILRTPGYQNIPIVDDTANSADVIAQDANTENVKDPVISNTIPGNVLWDSGTTWFAETLIESLDYDLLAYMQPMMDRRIEAKRTASWTAALTAGAGVGVTTASTTGVTIAELAALKFSLPAVYQADAVLFVSRGFFQAIYSLVDANGRPLYVESLSDDAPNRLFGMPVFIDDSLQAPGAGNIPAVIASASSLIVREAGPRRIVRYQDYPLRPDQIGLREFQNGGFAFVGAGVMVLKNHA